MLNTAVIMGRLTADPELRQTPNGVSVTSFTVACDRNYSSRSGGERPCDFINRERLKYSLFLLHETDCTILEISDSCGFSNLSHFYHLFRKSFSVSPHKARKMGKCIPGSI